MRIGLLCAAAAALLLFGCTAGEIASVGDRARPEAQVGTGASHARTEPTRVQRPRRVDPRHGGFEIALGEWALSPEVDAVRPGRITFVISNRGTMAHGFEISLEGDSSGHGSGDLFKAEGPLLRPGSTTKLTLDLQPGVYEIECLVDGHDDMGMEGTLVVTNDAPLIKMKPSAANDSDKVSIADFAFSPNVVTIDRGSEVTWHNDDVAPHTVTSTTEAFDSDTIEPGSAFSFRFSKPGTYSYRCLIHPEMKGTVTVR